MESKNVEVGIVESFKGKTADCHFFYNLSLICNKNIEADMDGEAIQVVLDMGQEALAQVIPSLERG